MYKQLREWMLYGNLNDKHGEFFIGLMETGSNSITSSSLSLAGGSATASTAPSGTSGYDDDVDDLNEIFSMGDRFSSGFSQYWVNLSLLPSFIEQKTANKILFNGELLQLFKSSSSGPSNDNAFDDDTVNGQISMISIMNMSFGQIQNNLSNKC